MLNYLKPCRGKYGEEATKQLLRETQRRNPSFYKAVMDNLAIDSSSVPSANTADGRAGAVAEEDVSEGTSGSGVSTGRRRLMADASGTTQ
jgi:hypothetical protein